MNNKPPLGLMPKQLYKEQRIKNILDAIGRYSINGQPVPIEWIEELNELMENPTDVRHDDLIAKIERLQDYVGLLAEKGLRCDLNPTHNLDKCEEFWHKYIKGIDERIVEEAIEVLEGRG